MGDGRGRLDSHRPPGRSAGRFVGHLRLLDACREPGCPVCRCLRELTLRHLDRLVSEHVTDPEARERLARSAGFCATHAALLSELREAALGVGIVYERLLAHARRWVAEAGRSLGRQPARGWRRLLVRRPAWREPARGRPAPCPPCAALADAERDCLATLLESIGEPELAQAYERSAGVCLPHLRLAVSQAPGHPGLALLLAGTAEKLDRLGALLRRFVDKHDHRTRAAFSSDEATAWLDALALLAGRPELFGHEIPRSPLAPRPPRAG